jgi:hypothetical protein
MKTVRFICLFLVAAAFTFAPASTTLEYKFKVGDVYEVNHTAKQSVKQTIPGMGEMLTDTESATNYRIKITEKTTTGAKAEITIFKIKVDTKSPMVGNISLDSEGDQTSPFNKILKSVTATTVVGYISKTGAVEKFEGVEKYEEGVKALGLDDATMAAGKQIVDQFASEKSLRGNLQMTLVQYPATKVKVGDTWKTSLAAPMNFPAEIANTWTLSNIEGTMASVDSDGTLTTTDKEKEFMVSGFKARADMNGRVATKGKADTTTGWATEVKGVSELKGTIILISGPGISEAIDIPTEIVTETSQTVTKK